MIVIPNFYLNICKVGDHNGNDRVTIYADEIRCASKSIFMKKKLLCKIILEDTSFRFITYILNSLITLNTMRQTIVN